MLYLIGLGLNDEKDISVKGLEIVKKADKVYLEKYTSVLPEADINKLSEFYGRELTPLEREGIENNSSKLIEEAKNKDIAVLIAGDALSATTHISLLEEAREKRVGFRVINNASIFTAVSITGLQLYKFGKVTSIPFLESNPDLETPYNVIDENKSSGLHTLCLLDLNPKEEKYMSVNEAIEILLKIEGKKKLNVFKKDILCVGCARLGGDYKIVAGEAKDLLNEDFGKPLHCLIIPGELHFMEEEMLNLWRR